MKQGMRDVHLWAALLLGTCLLLGTMCMLAVARPVQLPTVQLQGGDFPAGTHHHPAGRNLLGCGFLGLGSCSPITYCAQNNWGRTIRVCIMYKPADSIGYGCSDGPGPLNDLSWKAEPGQRWLSGSEWQAHCWWTLNPGEVKCMANSHNKVAYYHAEDDNRATWGHTSLCFNAIVGKNACDPIKVCGVVEVHKSDDEGKFTQNFGP